MILLLTQNFPPDPGGIEALMGEMAEQLVASGRTVLVLADHIRGRGLSEPSWPAGMGLRRFGGPRPIRRFRKALAARRVLAGHPVQGVIADSWKSLELLPRPDVPTLVLAHGSEFPPAASARKARRIGAALGKATAIAANSGFTAGLMGPYLPQDAVRPVVIHLPVAPQPAPDEEARRWAEGFLGGAGPVLLTVARLEPRKGIDSVLRALPALAGRHPGLRYVVAGGGEDETRLRRLARELGVEERVRFLGRVVDRNLKAALYAGADLFAMPSRREGASVEGFGLVYLEAAWHGLPAVAGSDGGAAEAVLDGETGLVCDGADDGAVAAALARLLDDLPLRRRMGEAAARRVRSGFGWETVLPRYLTLLEGQPARGEGPRAAPR
ncbi:glycosyltransferase family 4 protein [Muricoccus pecuniae]|uniref:Phosphatidylinositol alpha-1,6-mannosyltransferase n=1 Tax=Muricoccus pecuniae TaxID=693023 RepID=A0A840YF58_9PROT|nr:glycosyltransferase family 4 protein [Roseomonas pecuniae]MBB5692514.1 phosphatidylinositol alpha-1,6-mannosyltransferase [Roseomonas pecuniae]